jgi:hypothetical protein
MFRFVAPMLLALTLAPAAALAAQPLGIDLQTATPRVDKLDRYVAGEEVSVRVAAPPGSRVTIVGTGPDGSHLQLALAASPDGAYLGSLTLPVAGTWSFAADTLIGGEDLSTESFPVVVAEPESNVPALVMAALAVASLGGGIGLIVVRRRAVAQRP